MSTVATDSSKASDVLTLRQNTSAPACTISRISSRSFGAGYCGGERGSDEGAEVEALEGFLIGNGECVGAVGAADMARGVGRGLGDCWDMVYSLCSTTRQGG